jgi:nickel and cobalt resistance protein CnrR
MKPAQYSLLWSMGTVLVSAGVALLVTRFSQDKARSTDSQGNSGGSLHQWLHYNLQITDEQKQILHPLEHDFEKQEKIYRDEIKEAGLALAGLIRDDPDDRAQIEESRIRLNEAQGRLQQITLEHFFMMKQHLSPDQGEKLLEWTYQSLTHGHYR